MDHIIYEQPLTNLIVILPDGSFVIRVTNLRSFYLFCQSDESKLYFMVQESFVHIRIKQTKVEIGCNSDCYKRLG